MLTTSEAFLFGSTNMTNSCFYQQGATIIAVAMSWGILARVLATILTEELRRNVKQQFGKTEKHQLAWGFLLSCFQDIKFLHFAFSWHAIRSICQVLQSIWKLFLAFFYSVTTLYCHNNTLYYKLATVSLTINTWEENK